MMELRIESGMEDGDDEGGAPAAHEQQNGETGQDGRGQHLLHDVLDRRLHETGNVVERSDGDARRKGLEQARQLRLDATDHREGRGVPGFQDLDENRLLALDQHDVLLRRPAGVDVGYVTQIDDRVADLLEREIVEGFDLERRGIGLPP